MPPNTLIMYHNGKFYNSYEKDAETFLALGLVKKFTGGKSVPMTGVNIHSLETIIQQLTSLGYTVGVISQMENNSQKIRRLKRDSSGNDRCIRSITQIASPGTYNDGTDKYVYAVRCDTHFDVCIIFII